MEEFLKRMLLTKDSSVPTASSLSFEEAEMAMTKILRGEAKEAQIGAFLAVFHFRPPTGHELAGFVHAIQSFENEMRGAELTVCFPREQLLDVCGTGGDGLGSFNVSTATAIVVAACGQPVAKHGNRAVSSQCGSFDVLESLGISFATDIAHAKEQLDTFGLSFLYAPAFYQSLKQLAPLRKALGVRTIFNVLGPLLNPLKPRRQLIGVYAENLLEPVANGLNMLGATEAYVVRGYDGADEVSLSGTTVIKHLSGNEIRNLEFHPSSLSMQTHPTAAVGGGDANTNAKLLMTLFQGAPGPRRDITLINAAAALRVAGKAATMEEGVTLAREAIDSGRVLSLVQSLQNQSKVRTA